MFLHRNWLAAVGFKYEVKEHVYIPGQMFWGQKWQFLINQLLISEQRSAMGQINNN